MFSVDVYICTVHIVSTPNLGVPITLLFSFSLKGACSSSHRLDEAAREQIGTQRKDDQAEDKRTAG